MSQTVHLWKGEHPSCGADPHVLTLGVEDPTLVTCKRCERTKAYAEALRILDRSLAEENSK